MAKIVPRETVSTVSVRTKNNATPGDQSFKWWNAGSRKDLSNQVIATATYLKQQQQYRFRQAAIYSRLYGNAPIFNVVGSNLNRLGTTNSLPIDRPTMNVVQSCVDTLVSRITQSRPKPTFLTDNGDYKQRNLAKQMNSFINGELYQTKAYELGELILRDASVLGTGAIKILEADKKVCLERRLITELFVDPNDAIYGSPRQIFELKLVDKDVLKAMFPTYKSVISSSEQAYLDDSSENNRSISDQSIVVEGWHLPSGEGADDGLHVIACSSGLLFEEKWEKDKFPFVFLDYSPRMLGFWGQGLAEQLMGTQVEINKLLQTISSSINLVGVPRVFVEQGSKVMKAALNDQIGSIITYSGTKPSYEVAPCVPQELYAQLERLVQYAYQQSGISTLAATSQKPAGLNSGEAIRNYDDLQSDRFAALSKRYDNFFINIAYQIIDKAREICERDGSYQTVYPNKDGTKEIDLPASEKLADPFVIQCFDASSLPRDPSGRLAKVTEMMQAGLISPDEGRRLLDYPDIQQVDKLANSGEERILQYLDQIVDTGTYNPPDPFMNLELATKLTTEYYNLYTAAKLEESKAQMLRDFFTQIQTLKMAAMPQPIPTGMEGMAPGGAQAVPQAPPVSELLPNVPQ